MLLSLEDEEDQSEMDLLIKSLEERRSSENYTKIKAVTAQLGTMGEFGRSVFLRNPETMKRGKVFEYDHPPEDLAAAMGEIIERSRRRAPPPMTSFEPLVRQEPYPVASKAGEILERLKRLGITSFRLLFKGSRSRSEVVATFLAVLELCRKRMIRLAGSASDCTVTPTGEGGDTLSL